MINFLESIHSRVMCANFEIASVIFQSCIVREPAITPGPLLLACDTGSKKQLQSVPTSPLSTNLATVWWVMVKGYGELWG